MSKVIWEKFLKTVEKNNLVNSQDRVLAAVSSGPDSVCMVHLLKKLQKISVFDLGMVYVNHHLRKEKEIKKEIEFVKTLGKELNIPTFTTEIGLGKTKSNIESKARKLRYRELCRIASENNYNKIATAHTLNDNAETVLLNIVRSSNREGILGIPLVRELVDKKISIIRPMLQIEKSQIMNFLKINRIKFCVDTTNKDISFSRNFIRLKILPLLEKLNPSILKHLLNLAVSSYQKQLYVDDVIRKLVKKIVVKKRIGKPTPHYDAGHCDEFARLNTVYKCVYGKKVQFDLNKFFKYNIFLQQQIINRVIKDFVIRDNYSKLVDDIFEFIQSKKSVFISGNLEVKKNKRWLEIKLKN